MVSSLSSLVNNLAEGISEIKCNYGNYNKKCETCEIKYKECECCLEYTNFKDKLMVYKCLSCNRKYQKRFVENLKEQFANACNTSNHNVNKFILLL